MHESLLLWNERFFKLKNKSCNAQNRRYGEMYNCLFETYTNTVMTHGKHMFQTASGMEMEIMCAYPLSKYALSYWKCVLRCCA